MKFLSQKIDFLRVNWEKFYRPYKMNMTILKEGYPDGIEVSADILNNVRGTDILHPHVFMTFLAKELTNTKIL